MSAFPLLALRRDVMTDLTQVPSPPCKPYISLHLQHPMDVALFLPRAGGIVLLLAQGLHRP